MDHAKLEEMHTWIGKMVDGQGDLIILGDAQGDEVEAAEEVVMPKLFNSIISEY